MIGSGQLASTPGDARSQKLLRLLQRLIPEELQERLSSALGAAQAVQRELYLLLAQQILSPDSTTSPRQTLRDLGYGRQF